MSTSTSALLTLPSACSAGSRRRGCLGGVLPGSGWATPPTSARNISPLLMLLCVQVALVLFCCLCIDIKIEISQFPRQERSHPGNLSEEEARCQRSPGQQPIPRRSPLRQRSEMSEQPQLFDVSLTRPSFTPHPPQKPRREVKPAVE